MNRRSVIVRQGPAGSIGLGLGIGLVIALVAGYLMYDFGLSRAGFSRAAAGEKVQVLEAANKKLRKANKTLSERVAVLETAAKVDQEAYRQVDGQLAELQSKILAQQEDIEFYRGIVGEDDGSALRIQDFRVTAGRRSDEFELRLVLAQALRSNRDIAGQVELKLEGLQRSEPAVLGLSALGQEADTLDYSFLYFQDLKTVITMPAEFEPQRVQVVVRPRGKSAKTVEEFFVWRPETG